ncbi:MAG: hypothetical protein NTX55_01680 [Candidatus Parcubacteria bacterium]|nr:hypothetical protein [Candidatus Parcubacteria bacterium]
MILTTHAVVGGAIMKLMPHHPVTGLFLAFASHFVLDALPHWNYHLDSYAYNEKEPLKSVLYFNKKFLADLVKIGLDGTFGLILSVIMFRSSFPWVALGAISAMFPDFLQFLYLQTRREPFLSLQRFHLWIHTKHEIKKINFAGIISQIAIIVLAIII